jgi:hypothetical protein
MTWPRPIEKKVLIMKKKCILLILFYLPLCVVVTFPAKTFAENVLIFKGSTMNAAYMPHTIVLPDCKSLSYMAVQTTCPQTGENLSVYSLLTGTCSDYGGSILVNFFGADETITALLDQAPFVLFDTGTGAATPIDLASAAVCADLGGGGGGHTDRCPNDPNKTQPGICGCGVPDSDADSDDTPDCNDNCPNIYNPGQEDSNANNIGDACECEGDSEPDGDVDGSDLAQGMGAGGLNIIQFADDFGRTNCPGI